MATSDYEPIVQTQVEAYIPNIWRGRRFLYVGASVDQFQLKYGLKLSWDFYNAHIDVLEIDSDRAKQLRDAEGPWIRKVIIDDVSELHMEMVDNLYDRTIWANGPGILEVEKINRALDRLESISFMVVILNPWGRVVYRNGEDELMDPNDVFRTPLLPDFFQKRGYAVHTIGERDKEGGNILAWKYTSIQLKPWRMMPCAEEEVRF